MSKRRTLRSFGRAAFSLSMVRHSAERTRPSAFATLGGQSSLRWTGSAGEPFALRGEMPGKTSISCLDLTEEIFEGEIEDSQDDLDLPNLGIGEPSFMQQHAPPSLRCLQRSSVLGLLMFPRHRLGGHGQMGDSLHAGEEGGGELSKQRFRGKGEMLEDELGDGHGSCSKRWAWVRSIKDA
jgi:hypothetical protein